MSQKNPLDLAIEALKNSQYKKASNYYEKYAESIINTDMNGAACNFSLAAQYEKEAIERSLFLYEKAYSLYEQLNNTLACSDIFIAIAILFNNNDKKKAIFYYKKAILSFTEIVTYTVSNTEGSFENDKVTLINDCTDKIKFCLKKMTD